MATTQSTSPSANDLSDIFSESPPDPYSDGPQHPSEPSDVPRLRSIHVTNGYRDGISSSKDQALQPGFDEAYPLGAILGLRVGYILGVLEGLCGSYRLEEPALETGRREDEKRVRELLSQAREELIIEKLFEKEYWGSDGMWAYDVHPKDEDPMFWEVADQHPVMRRWLDKVRDEVRKAGIQNAEQGFVGIGEAGASRLEHLQE
ncbi:MAG: hypothetical protein LQ346_002948 [Caloplaca aetnensis]|nr:MAG: hypothetical protein LQ346_002948 [Caloplaca aetnensis]